MADPRDTLLERAVRAARAVQDPHDLTPASVMVRAAFQALGPGAVFIEKDGTIREPKVGDL